MATIKKFEDLDIWKEARRLSLQIFEQTVSNEQFSKDFRFKDQIKAAAGSVMDNIAEGFERSSRLEFINFLSIAKGSCGEVKSQIYRAKDQSYISEDIFNELYFDYDKLAAGIAGFISYLNNSEIKGQKFKDRK
jgi:four helix bundle protein